LTRLLIASAVVALVSTAACGGGSSPSSSSPDGSRLLIEDLVVGTGPAVVVGDTVSVNYVGTFTDGRQFDSSADHGGPYAFRVGAGQVIAGWDQGVPGMQVGGRRRLTIPPSLAYGSQGRGVIPPNATLVFEIELVSIDS